MAKKDEGLVSLLKELVTKLAGKGSDAIVDILFGKKNVNEFKIADQLKITINQARNILYRLTNAGILESTKKKDKRKGWYTYFWTLNMLKSLAALEKIKLREMELAYEVLKTRELKSFYSCPTDNIEMSEETALHHSFLCHECGALLQPVPKEKRIKEITSRIEAIKREIASILVEVEKIKPKVKIKEAPTKPKKKAKQQAGKKVKAKKTKVKVTAKKKAKPQAKKKFKKAKKKKR
jgi:transcription factor E